VVDVADVDGRLRIDGRARDESVELDDEDDLVDAVHVDRAELVSTHSTDRATGASQLAERHRITIRARRYSLHSQVFISLCAR